MMHCFIGGVAASLIFFWLSGSAVTTTAFTTPVVQTQQQHLRRSSSSLLRSSTSTTTTTSDEFLVGVLGDLHMDPRVMQDYETGRSHWLPIFEEAVAKHGNAALVSLGDLGESKSVRPAETSELFAGTTECHELAAGYLSTFGVPYEVVGGNHGTYSLCSF